MKLQNLSLRRFLLILSVGVVTTAVCLIVVFYLMTDSGIFVLYGALLTTAMFIWGVILLKFLQKKLDEFTPQITFTSRVARIMVPQQGQTYLILRLMDFLLPPLEPPSTCRRLVWIPASPKVALIQASASGAGVVTVQPYFACFSICSPWASAVALNFML